MPPLRQQFIAFALIQQNLATWCQWRSRTLESVPITPMQWPFRNPAAHLARRAAPTTVAASATDIMSSAAQRLLRPVGRCCASSGELLSSLNIGMRGTLGIFVGRRIAVVANGLQRRNADAPIPLSQREGEDRTPYHSIHSRALPRTFNRWPKRRFGVT